MYNLSCLREEAIQSLRDEIDIDDTFPDEKALVESQDLIP